MKYAVEISSNTKFYKDWFRRSEINKVGFADTESMENA
jgi:hypothetical protein